MRIRIPCLIRKGYLCFLTLSVLSASAQDSTGLRRFIRDIDLDLTGGNYYQTNVISPVLLPESIRQSRTQSSRTFNQNWRNITDNPFFHGAYYLAVNAKCRIGRSVVLDAAIIGEHRGASYGVTNTPNIIVFPQMNLALDKSVPLFGKDLRVFGSIANQTNPQIGEGLMIYNMYQHGTDINVSWGKFRLRYLQLSDLLRGIGLDINDSRDLLASFEQLKLSNKEDPWQADIRLGYSDYSRHINIDSDRFFCSLSGGIYKSALRLYFHAAMRPVTLSVFDAEEKLGALVGAKWKKVSKKIKTELVAEGRFYGAGYNSGFKNPNVWYRRPGTSSLYANTIGDHFYPLMLYDRPFSQWAVFTEYQGKNVSGLTLRANNSFYLYKSFALKADVDLNYIQASGEPGFLYPFYHVGLGWESGRNSAFIGATNKGLNLDLYYPTFYLYQQPCVMVTIKRDLSEDW